MQQPLLHDDRNTPISGGTNIQAQVTAFRDHVYQQVDQRSRGFIVVGAFQAVIAERFSDTLIFFPLVRGAQLHALGDKSLIFGSVEPAMFAASFLSPAVVDYDLLAHGRVIEKPRQKLRRIPLLAGALPLAIGI